MNNSTKIEIALKDILNCEIKNANDEQLYYALLKYTKNQTADIKPKAANKKVYYILG
jgi:starch phosphorylase